VVQGESLPTSRRESHFAFREMGEREETLMANSLSQPLHSLVLSLLNLGPSRRSYRPAAWRSPIVPCLLSPSPL
jgi:hypothetical protein